jgi:hypothetical protein
MAILDDTTEDILARKRKKRLSQAGISINTTGGSISIMRKSMSPTIPGDRGGGMRPTFGSQESYGPSLVSKESLAPSWTRSATRAKEERIIRLSQRGG